MTSVYVYGVEEPRSIDDDWAKAYPPFFDGVEAQGDPSVSSFLHNGWELLYSRKPHDRDILDNEDNVIEVTEDISNRPELLATLFIGQPVPSKRDLIYDLFTASTDSLLKLRKSTVEKIVHDEFVSLGSLASRLSYTEDDVVSCIMNMYVQPLRMIGLQPFNDGLLRQSIIDAMQDVDRDKLLQEASTMQYGALESPIMGVYAKTMDTIIPGYLHALEDHSVNDASSHDDHDFSNLPESDD